jgi:hypothetical protein
MEYAGNPIILIPALCFVAGLVLVVFAFRTSHWIYRVLLICFGAILCLPAVYVFPGFHPELVDARYRTYKAFYRDIREGMTREEVLSLVDRHYPSTGPRQRPKIMQDTPERLGFFMTAETSFEPNCEGIFLALQEGRVSRKQYVRD